MQVVGSQRRESLQEAGYKKEASLRNGDLILTPEDGPPEVWTPNDDYAGNVIVIDGVGHEFVRAATILDLREI